MYKILNNSMTGEPSCVQRSSDTAFIPFDPANTDYQKFKVDVMEGAELEDQGGVPMTPDEAVAYISNLP